MATARNFTTTFGKNVRRYNGRAFTWENFGRSLRLVGFRLHNLCIVYFVIAIKCFMFFYHAYLVTAQRNGSDIAYIRYEVRFSKKRDIVGDPVK